MLNTGWKARRLGSGVGVMVIAALVAAGCGGGGHRAAKGPSSPPSSAANVATSTPGSAGASGSGDASGAGSQTDGLSATTITIGQITTNSGPQPGGTQKALDALNAYANYINAQGGVDGRKLKVVQLDDDFNCNLYTNELKKLTTSVFASVGNFSVLDGCGLATLKANPTFPVIEGYVLNGTLLTLPNVTTPFPQPYGYPTTGAVWIKNKFPNDITHMGALYLSQARSSFDELGSAYKAEGFKYVYSRGTGATETNFTSDILRMKGDGVEVVDLMSESEQSVAQFIQQADQQGFHPDVVISAQAYDANLFKNLGATKADNLYMPLLFPMYLGEDIPNNPALATMTTWLDKVHAGEIPDLYSMTGWSAGALFVQALKAAGANPTRTGLINALDRITSFSAGGLIPTTNPGQRQGAVCMVIVGIKDRKFVRLDPPTKGWECNGTYNHITAAEASA